MSLLSVKNLSISFGGLKAVDDLSFDIPTGKIFALIGPNGAGKTTVFNCITQFYKDYSGEIHFNGQSGKQQLIDYKVHDIISMGMVRSFQNVELIEHMTVIDNLLVGLHYKIKTNLFEEILGLSRKKEVEYHKDAMEILDFLGISDKAYALVSQQSYGTRKLIELGRTLISKPKIILLDEPAAGMNAVETKALSEIILRIKNELNISVFLIEHDMGLVMDISDEIVVLNFGKKVAQGEPEYISNNEKVQEAYLGGD